jgi:hypothetical protein
MALVSDFEYAWPAAAQSLASRLTSPMPNAVSISPGSSKHSSKASWAAR